MHCISIVIILLFLIISAYFGAGRPKNGSGPNYLIIFWNSNFCLILCWNLKNHEEYGKVLIIFHFPGNILTDYMCLWRRCLVNNSELYMFDIGFHVLRLITFLSGFDWYFTPWILVFLFIGIRILNTPYHKRNKSVKLETKELSLCHKLWFSNSYIFAVQCCRHLTF